MSRSVVLLLAVLAAFCGSLYFADAKIVFAEFTPHKHGALERMVVTIRKNIEDAVKMAHIAKSMGGTVLVLPEWMFMSSTYVFFPNSATKGIGKAKQWWQLHAMRGIKDAVLRFDELRDYTDQAPEGSRKYWNQTCAALERGEMKWHMNYLRCIAVIAKIDVVCMSFTEHSPAKDHTPIKARTPIYNSLLYLRHDDDRVLVYDKMHLINHEAPWMLFGAPARKLVGKDMRAFFGPEVASDASELKFGNVMTLNVDGKPTRVGLLICYDIMFPDTLHTLIRHDPTIKTFLVVTQWGNLNAIWGVTIQQGVARAYNVTIIAANINTDAEAPDRETGSGWYYRGFPVLHTMGRMTEAVMSARMLPDMPPTDAEASEPLSDDNDGPAPTANLLFKKFKRGSKRYALFYSKPEEQRAGVARATLMSLDQPEKWVEKRKASVERFFQDDNMIEDLPKLPTFWKEIPGGKRGAALSLQEIYIISDPNKCKMYSDLVSGENSKTKKVVCLDGQANKHFMEDVSILDVACRFEFNASVVGPNDVFVAQAIVVAKRVPEPGHADYGDRYSRGCLFFAVNPPKDTCSRAKLENLQKTPRGRDMSYLTKVQTRWNYVRVVSNVRGRNIATVPLTGVLKRYRSSANNETVIRVAPITARTGCTSSWRKLHVTDPHYGRFPSTNHPTVLEVTGSARGCAAVDVSLYGTGQPLEELQKLDRKIEHHIEGMEMRDLSAADTDTDDSDSVGEKEVPAKLQARLEDSDDIVIKERLIMSTSLRRKASKPKRKVAEDDSDDDESVSVRTDPVELARASSSDGNDLYSLTDFLNDPWCEKSDDPDDSPRDRAPADGALSPQAAPKKKTLF